MVHLEDGGELSLESSCILFLFVSLPYFSRCDSMTLVGNWFLKDNISCYLNDGHKDIKELLVLHFIIFKAKFFFFFGSNSPT